MFSRLTIVGVAAALVLPFTTATAASAHDDDHDHFPATIDLPAGFVGEGVAVGAHNTFYAGSVADGRIATGDLRAGVSRLFVSNPTVPSATGLKADRRHNLLWVSGAGTGMAAVYNLTTGASVKPLTLTTAPAFINDVIVTRDAAYFTNSFTPEIYRVPVSKNGAVGTPETIALHGPAADDYVAGAFNLNGIEATNSGRTLISVNSTTGKLYTIDPQTGNSAVIDVGGVLFPTADGLLLQGRTLYVLQNGNTDQAGVKNEIVVVKLRHHLSEGRVVDRIGSPLFETATTLARRGDVLVAVNSQFGGAPIDPESELVLVKLDDDHRGDNDHDDEGHDDGHHDDD